MIDHMIQVLQLAGLHEIYISGQLESYLCIPDRIKDCGPLGGIYATLNAIEAQRFLFVPVDMPLLTPQLLKNLAENNHEAVCYCGYNFPLILNRSQPIIAVIKNQLDKKQNSIKAMLDVIPSKHMPITQHDESKSFLNVNSPKQWRRLAKI
jgi:molybdenum cofactor guanylyltransferase